MVRDRIDYGIDLGTTNSAIARMEKGEPTIRKSDLNHDTMPSCVGWNRKGVLMAGDTSFNQLQSDRLRSLSRWTMEQNIFIEFKRTMGTDKKYKPAALEKEFSSEELSAEVLKKLKSFVQDENVRAAVITVPAKFTVNQKDATARAAKLAGLEQFELLQEPVAACMAYGLGNAAKSGLWVVFDFGGGTFDAALVKADEGILKVLDTEGDNYLGGKNLDYAVVDEIILPHLAQEFDLEDVIADESKHAMLRDAMKRYAEQARIQLSFKNEHHVLTELGEIPLQDASGTDVELDLSITQDRMAEALTPVYQRAIDLTKQLLQRNHVETDKLSAVVLVGGPTYSPQLRSMVAGQLREPDTHIDPMTAVAVGAALYASTLKVEEELAMATRDMTKVQLDLNYESTTVQTEEFVTVKLLSGDGGRRDLQVEFERNDGSWASGRCDLTEKGDVVDVSLSEGVVNRFTIRVYDANGDRLECEPDSFSIIQGTQVSAAPLPNNIGLEVLRRQDNKRVFVQLRGLEKNQSLPATGVTNGLRTSVDLRPGNAKDVLRIPLYEADYEAVGSLAILNEHIYDAVVTGADVPALVPSGSEVDLTVVTDRSGGRPVSMKVFFPQLDEEVMIEVPEGTTQKEVDAGWLDRKLDECEREIDRLAEQEGVPEADIDAAREELGRLHDRFEQDRNDYDAKKEVLDHLKTLWRKVDRMRSEGSWPVLKAELDELYEQLVKANAELGNAQTTLLVQNLKERMDRACGEKNIRVAERVKEEMDHLFFELTKLYRCIGTIRHAANNFRTIHWKDAAKARGLVDRGIALVASDPRVEALLPICRELWALMPDDERPADTGGLLTD